MKARLTWQQPSKDRHGDGDVIFHRLMDIAKALRSRFHVRGVIVMGAHSPQDSEARIINRIIAGNLTPESLAALGELIVRQVNIRLEYISDAEGAALAYVEDWNHHVELLRGWHRFVAAIAQRQMKVEARHWELFNDGVNLFDDKEALKIADVPV